MNSPIDPATVKKPPLDLAVVIDHSGSMAESGKEDYARQGVKLLVDQLGSVDTLTLIEFDDGVTTLFGPAHVTDAAAVKAIVDQIQPAGSTNLYGGLEAGYQAALMGGDETQQRRVIFLTDGLPTAGNTDTQAIEQMSAGYNEQHVGLTTIGLGTDVDAGLLRQLSEQGGGNFYFLENPTAVTQVFTEELAFFVAPIAYDLDLVFTTQPSYQLQEVYGTHLWQPSTSGGKVHVPSVFLTSRTSSAPDMLDGGVAAGRRGGGSAIIARLAAAMGEWPSGQYDVAQLHLDYRLPGTQTHETQDVTVRFVGIPGEAPAGGYYSDQEIEKNTLMLAFYVAFRDATALASTQHDVAAALSLLSQFQPRIAARLQGTTDADLLDDLQILQQYIAVLQQS
jgi:Ca-activated chloride channel family protein